MESALFFQLQSKVYRTVIIKNPEEKFQTHSETHPKSFCPTFGVQSIVPHKCTTLLSVENHIAIIFTHVFPARTMYMPGATGILIRSRPVPLNTVRPSTVQIATCLPEAPSRMMASRKLT